MFSQRENPSQSHLSPKDPAYQTLPLLLLAYFELLACLNMVRSSLSILHLCNRLQVSQHPRDPILDPPV